MLNEIKSFHPHSKLKKSSLLSAAFMGAILASCGKASEAPPQSIDAVETNIAAPIKSAMISADELKGQFITAGENTPVVIIVPGSGPTDLDGNNPMGVSANSYKMLAEGLAAKGISTVRIDKRGMFSSKAAGDANAVTLDIYAQDYRDWAKAVKAQTGQDCVYLLGHSEGGLMVSSAAADNADVCGLILLAAPGRSMGDILREQLKANPANVIILKEANAAIDTLETGKKVDTSELNPLLKPLFNDSVQGFLMSVMKVDPAALAKSADKKTLIIQGTHDIQVKPEDAKLLADATGGALVLIDGMNHILKDAPANRVGNMMTYSKPDLPLSPEVVESISEFVLD